MRFARYEVPLVQTTRISVFFFGGGGCSTIPSGRNLQTFGLNLLSPVVSYKQQIHLKLR